MATIGLDKLFYAKITEDEDGDETYATPVPLAKAMKPWGTSSRGMGAALYSTEAPNRRAPSILSL